MDFIEEIRNSNILSSNSSLPLNAEFFYLFLIALLLIAFIIYSVIMKARQNSIAQQQSNINQVKVVKKFINPCKANAFNQTFALPKPLMDHLTQQPSSPKAWIKLIQTCKYFFGSNPILVASGFQSESSNLWAIFNLNNKYLEFQTINFEPCKLWLMGGLLSYENENSEEVIDANFPITKMVSNLIPHIYKSGLRRLGIENQELSFEEFQFLTQEKKIWNCYLSGTVITYADGKIVPLEVILEALPVIHAFKLDNSYKFITPETSENLQQLPKVKNFTQLTLKGLRNNLKPESFVQFLRNQKLQSIDLYFTDAVSWDYVVTIVVAMRKYTEDRATQQFINQLNVYHKDDLIFEYSFDMMF